MKHKTFVFTVLLIGIFFCTCRKETTTPRQTNQEYFDYTLDGISYHFEPIVDTLTVTSQLTSPPSGTPIRMYIVCMRWNQTSPGGITLTCVSPGAIPGTYPSSEPGAVWNGIAGFTIPQNAVQVSLNSYAANRGEFFKGTFIGSFIDQGTTHTLSGSFNVKRNY